MNVSPETMRLLTLSMIKGIGSQTLRRVSTVPAFHSMSVDALAPFISTTEQPLTQALWNEATDAANDQLEKADKHQVAILSPFDSKYPALLHHSHDHPGLIWVRGKLAATPEKSIAVIGTRNPTGHGRIVTQRLTEFLVTEGWSIVSGLALGCDATAHEAALDADGHTVAVLAHGLHMTSPSKHQMLADRIIEQGGSLVSEYPFGQAPASQMFVKRDRTQAGLSKAVVMIQSSLKGGSLHAARAALSYGRWLATPYPTKKDLLINDPHIQANLLCANGDAQQKRDLLRCQPDSLKNIIVLKSKADYHPMLDRISANNDEQPTQHTPLL